MFCCLSNHSSESSASIMCGKNDLSFAYSENFLSSTGGYINRADKCKAAKNNTRAHRLCSAIGTKGNIGNLWTPQGVVSPYTNYRIR